ncbi:hypothetical protein ON064_02995 [Planococcus sp. A6]|uniref:hypothetical protein n=1 Tax=Planococcus sp. A6 TaxID=2992760 RepID=UPI00237B11CE|nr:hypothetical protein [Planococcus sp. A6]MDE0582011.1 hypothetical protein [Planococcus sp. A6]
MINETIKKGLNKNIDMKDSGIEWIGEIPGHWEIKKLKEVGSLYSAGVDKKIRDNEKLYKSVHYTDVYYNSLKQISNNDDYLIISATEEKAEKANLLKGDVLFTSSSETPDDIGHSTVVEENLLSTLMGYHLMRFRPKVNMVLEYEKYAFGSNYLREWFSLKANGITRYGIVTDDYKNAPFLLIPQKEQLEISKYLDEKCSYIDSIIKDKIRLIKEFETYKKSLIYEYITGKKEVL